MSIEGRQITVGKSVYTLEELSIDRTLRLTDIVFRVLDKMSDEVQTEFTEFVQNYRINNELTVTPRDIKEEDDEAQAIIDGGGDLSVIGDIHPLRGLLESQGIDPDKLTEPIAIPKDPSEEEVIGFFLPKVYAIARPELLTLFALVLAENAKMAEAEDKPGGVDGYLKEIGNKVKHEGKTKDLVNLLAIAWEVAKEEFDRIKSAGNLPAPLTGLLGDSQTSTTDEPTPST